MKDQTLTAITDEQQTAAPDGQEDIVEAKIAAFAKEFQQIEGEGLKKDIRQGRIIREVRQLLKDDGRWCAFITDDLRTNPMRIKRLVARARAADIVPFNDALNLTKTVIDILAAEKVPDGALKEAVERSKNGEDITEAVAKEIAAEALQEAGIRLRKSRKGATQQGGQNSIAALEALRWVKPALAKTAAIKSKTATQDVLVDNGYISAFSGSLLARAPVSEDGTFMLDATILDDWLQYRPEFHATEDAWVFTFPEDDPSEPSGWLTKLSTETFAPKNTGLVDRYPGGESYKLSRALLFALAYLQPLTSRKPGRRVENGIWLVEGDALVVNLPKIACVRGGGLSISSALKLPNDAIRFIMKHEVGPDELLVEPDCVWFRWSNGAHLYVPRNEASENAAAALAKALEILGRYSQPAIKIRDRPPSFFERANNIVSKSIEIHSDRLSASVHGGPRDAAAPASTGEPATKVSDAIDFKHYGTFLPFKYGKLTGVIGIPRAPASDGGEAKK
jgi:hypothetical protein